MCAHKYKNVEYNSEVMELIMKCHKTLGGLYHDAAFACIIFGTYLWNKKNLCGINFCILMYVSVTCYHVAPVFSEYVCLFVCLFICLFLSLPKDIFSLLLEKGWVGGKEEERERERKRERKTDGQTLICCLPYTPQPGPNSQPRHIP